MYSVEIIAIDIPTKVVLCTVLIKVHMVKRNLVGLKRILQILDLDFQFNELIR